jgi:hypothetical protein
VIPAGEFPEWSSADQPIDKRSLQNRTWPKSIQTTYAKFPHFTSSSSNMSKEKLNWTRRVTLLNLDNENPIVLLYDSVNNKAENIWSMLFMSEGDIQTPTGPVSPEKRVHNNGSEKQLPNGTSPRGLEPGLNKFSFSGQTWNKKYHPSSGIDWDLYTYTESNSSFSTAQWTTTWQNNQEQIEFRNSNGWPYEEAQQILRWKSSDPFFSIILPYAKGNPYKNGIGELGKGFFFLNFENDSLIFSKDGFRATTNEKIFAGSWSENEFYSNNISIMGGPAEIEISPKSVFVRLHGNPGKRVIKLPVKNLTLAAKSKNVVVKKYPNHTEIQINYINKSPNLLSSEKGYTEVIFHRPGQSR